MSVAFPRRPSASSPRPQPTRAQFLDIETPPAADLAQTFAELGLTEALVRAVADEGYTQPTPIQAQAIPHLLAGKDLLGCAQTGTGKTAAFVLPLLEHLAKKQGAGPIRGLVLTPTRELAAQICERATAYGKHVGVRHAVIFGGVSQRGQEMALRRGPALIVATPGRLLDLMQQGLVRLDALEVLVLDEADRMLDMGFIHDVRRIVATLKSDRQTVFFSATMPPAIADLAATILRNPVRVAVVPAATTADTVEQSVYFVSRPDKRVLLERLLRSDGVHRSIVFTRTKHGANRVSEQLCRAGIESAAIHGDKSQNARERALSEFRRGRTTVLVATDLAARGIDVDGISHVFNYDLPNVAESYVHRIGRTGRAGATGSAISFCDAEERPLLTGIERLIRRRIRVADHAAMGLPAALETAPSGSGASPPGHGARPQGPHHHGGGRHGSPTSGDHASRGGRAQSRHRGPRPEKARTNDAS